MTEFVSKELKACKNELGSARPAKLEAASRTGRAPERGADEFRNARACCTRTHLGKIRISEMSKIKARSVT